MPKNKDNKTEPQKEKRVTATITLEQWKVLTLEAVEKLGSNSPSDMVQHLIDEHLNKNSK